MKPNELLSKLSGLGVQASVLTLQKIFYSKTVDGVSTQAYSWAYSNKAPAVSVSAFGDDSIDVSYSGYNLKTKTPVYSKSNIGDDGIIHTFWLNGIKDEDASAYLELFGEFAMCAFDEKAGKWNLMTCEETEKFITSFSIPSQKDVSKSASA